MSVRALRALVLSTSVHRVKNLRLTLEAQILYTSASWKASHFNNRSLHSCSRLNRPPSDALNMSSSFAYPEARRDETVVEDYHGTPVADPYRWLEDPDSDETKAFVQAQNDITTPYLQSYKHRDDINKRLTAMWDFPKYGCPYKRGSRYFYSYNTGLQNHSVTYVKDSLDGEPRVFLDPNSLSDDGTVSVSSKSFTKDGSLCAVALSYSGSDWVTVKFIDVATGDYLPDILTKVRYSCLTFTPDNKGLFYNSYPDADDSHQGKETESKLNQKLLYHRLGTQQTEDAVCAEFPDNPKWMSAVELSDCKNYLILSIVEDCMPVNRVSYFDLRTLGSDCITGLLPFVTLVDNFDASYDYITNSGSVLTFKSNKDAPRYRLINIDLERPEPAHWAELIPQHDKDVLEDVLCANDKYLITIYMQDVKNVMYLCDLATGQRLSTFPLSVGSVGALTGRREDSEVFYYFTSFLTPGCVYRCDLSLPELKPEVYKEISISGVDVSQFETEQVFYTSKDGTKIPMFLVHRKNLVKDGSSPVWLYGYGGFNISLTPYFSVSRLLFLQHFDGIFALANIRGGGEYGQEWHKAGVHGKRQNCYDDFQGAAEYLIKEKYTCSEKLAINGGSNGGLLVGACVNQRPDLFKVAIADVGVMDMLRFHKFTIGHAWVSDFGCSDDKDGFSNLIKYSPLHNVREPIIGQYPALLLVTADHDDRVVPLHSLKFIATVQHALGGCQKQTNPLLIRVECKAGHGAGKPTSKIIEEITDKITFMALNMDLQWKD